MWFCRVWFLFPFHANGIFKQLVQYYFKLCVRKSFELLHWYNCIVGIIWNRTWKSVFKHGSHIPLKLLNNSITLNAIFVPISLYHRSCTTERSLKTNWNWTKQNKKSQNQLLSTILSKFLIMNHGSKLKFEIIRNIYFYTHETIGNMIYVP